MSTTPKHRELVPTRADKLSIGVTVARSKHISVTVVAASVYERDRHLVCQLPKRLVRWLHLPSRKAVVYLRFTDGAEKTVPARRHFPVVGIDAGLIGQPSAAARRSAALADAVAAAERSGRQLTPLAG